MWNKKMSFISFDKPKKTILNLLFFTGILSLIISIFAVLSLVIWTYFPGIVMQIDKQIPDYYGDHIQSLYVQAENSTDTAQQYHYFSELYAALEDVSALNKYYSYRQEAAKFLINYYLQNNRVNHAMLIAEKWEKSYPYDFTGKFMYARVLSLTDNNKSHEYYQKLYVKHKDIKDVREAYIHFLIDEKKYNLAIQKAVYNQSFFQKHAFFQVFYNDNEPGFSQTQSLLYKNIKYDEVNKSYHIKLSRTFENFKSIRLDIDKVQEGSLLSNVEVSISDGRFNELLDVLRIYDLNQYGEGVYSIEGDDPHVIFNLGERLKNYAGKLDILFSLKIQGKSPINKILQHPDWQLSFGKGQGFDKKESFHLQLRENANHFVANPHIAEKGVKRVRLAFPGLLNLRIDDIEIMLNEKELLNKDNISLLHDIKIEKGQLEIIGSEPFVILEIKRDIDIQKLTAKIIFNEINHAGD